MSRNPNQRHKKLDALEKEKNHRMVQDYIKRQKSKETEQGLEVVVTLVAQKIGANRFHVELIEKELKALAGLFKRNGKTKDDFQDAVLWMESELGFKLLPKKPIH